jgi:serine-type D-Ala-D-Ala carboxypeptidase/endopeptidase (penicillin-binding protein 4)
VGRRVNAPLGLPAERRGDRSRKVGPPLERGRPGGYTGPTVPRSPLAPGLAAALAAVLLAGLPTVAAPDPGAAAQAQPAGQAVAQPAGQAQAPSRAGSHALTAAIDDLVLNGPLAEARAGVCVVSLDSGATLYARGADQLLNPASNVKLFTAAAALARLGPEFRFDTEVSTDGASAGLPGGAARSLYVRGKGDPALTTERLHALASDLAHLGLRRVGDLVLDDGWFDAVRVGPGFDQEAGDKAYLAPAGALSLNFNTVAVHVGPGERPGAPGRVELEPESAYLEVVNRTTTGGPRAARRLVVAATPLPGGRLRVLVEGRLPAGGRTSVSSRRIDDPPRYLGETLRRLLEQHGVKVTGRVKLGPVPADARLLHVAESEPLGVLVRRLQKTSNNFMAEQLLKALGAATAGPPGSWGSGVAAVEAFLSEVGIPRGAYVMKNGSGLNDANRFSARQTVQLLAAMARRFPLAFEFLAALPVAGKDGTIRTRMEGTDAVGQVLAKTGTLDGVVTLSGYVETAGHERLAFAIFVNDHGGRNGAVTHRVDELAALLAGRGKPAAGAASPVGPGAQSAAGGEGAADALAVDATVRTYLAMGRAGDRRNLPFLRTALRAEGAPAVRLAVAEALYRSSPDSSTAQRAFLEAVAAAPGAAALQPVLAAAEPADPVPVLAALADLAASESAEALDRLVALAPAAPEAPLVRPALGPVLLDLADVVPEPLRAAVAAAPPAAREAAAALLGDRLPGLLPAAAEAPTMGPAPGPAAPAR